MNAGPRALLILNPVAGSVDDADALEERLARELDCRVERTRQAGDALKLARSAAVDERPVVMAAGGDGTVAEVIQGLVDGSDEDGVSPSLIILPLGTGNDLARCLEIPLELEPALALAAEDEAGVPRSLDVMEVALDGESFLAVNAVVIGNGGRLGDLLDPEMKARWGPLSYLRSAGEVAFDLAPAPVTLELDGGTPQAGEILNLVVANGRYAGGGISIAPGADPSDGRLEVVEVLPAPLPDLLALLPTLLREQDPDADIYRHRSASSVRVRTRDGELIPVSVDGENREAREIDVTIRPARLQVRVPGR